MAQKRSPSVRRILLVLATVSIFLAGCGNPLVNTIRADAAARFPHASVLQGTLRLFPESGTSSFGGINVGEVVSKSFVIENSGQAALQLTGNPRVALSGPDADAFVVDTQPGESVAPGGTDSFVIEFQPLNEGPKIATVTIACNDPEYPQISFTVTGTGVNADPEISVELDGTELASGSVVSIGSTAVGAYSDVVFSIWNLDDDISLNLSGVPRVTVSDMVNFAVTAQPGSPIFPESYDEFTVRFSPTSIADHSADVSIVSDDPDETPYVVTLSAQGVASPTPEITIFAGSNITDGGSYSFAATDVQSDTDVIFTLRNDGSSSLTLTGPIYVLVSGADASNFIVISQPASPVGATGETTFTIRFSPDEIRTFGASVTIGNNDPDENPFEFDLSGDGQGPVMLVTQDLVPKYDATGEVDVGNCTVGTPVSVALLVENHGNTDLSLTGTPRVVLSGAHSGDYEVTTFPAATIAPDGSSSLVIRCNASAVGTRSALVTIESNDADTSPYTFFLTAMGVVPEIAVKVDSTYATDGGARMTIGTTEIGVPFEAIVTIENNGAGVLDLGAEPRVTLSGAGYAVTQPAQYVQPSDFTTFTLSYDYDPLSPNTYADLAINNNDPDEDPFDLDVRVLAEEWAGISEVAVSQVLGPTHVIVDDTDPWVWVSYFDEVEATIHVAFSLTGGSTWYSDVAVQSAVAAGQNYGFAREGTTNAFYVSYYDTVNDDLKLVRSADAGQTWSAPRTIDSTDDVGKYSSIVAPSGTVYIAYFDETNDDLKAASYTWSTDTTNYITTVYSTGAVGYFPHMDWGYGFVIASYDSTNGNLLVSQTSDVNNPASWATAARDTTGTVGRWPYIRSFNDTGPRILVSHHDYDNKIRVTYWNGTAWSTVVAVDSGFSSSSFVLAPTTFDMTLAYHESLQADLKIATTSNYSTFSHSTVSSIGDSGNYNDIAAVGSTLYVSFIYYNFGSSRVWLAKSLDGGTTWD